MGTMCSRSSLAIMKANCLCWSSKRAMEEVNKRLRQQQTEEEALIKKIARLTSDLVGAVHSGNKAQISAIMKTKRSSELKLVFVQNEINSTKTQLESKAQFGELEKQLYNSRALEKVAGGITPEDAQRIAEIVGNSAVSGIHNATTIHEAVGDANLDVAHAIHDALDEKERLAERALGGLGRNQEEVDYEEALAIVAKTLPSPSTAAITLKPSPTSHPAQGEEYAFLPASLKPSDIEADRDIRLDVGNHKRDTTFALKDETPDEAPTAFRLSERHAAMLKAALNSP